MQCCKDYKIIYIYIYFFFGAGLPIQVRDTGLSVKDEVPRSDVNKEYYTQNMEREVICLYLMLYDVFIGKNKHLMVSTWQHSTCKY